MEVDFSTEQRGHRTVVSMEVDEYIYIYIYIYIYKHTPTSQ